LVLSKWSQLDFKRHPLLYILKGILHVGQDLPYKPFGSDFIYFPHVGLMGEEASPNEKTNLSARLPGFKST